MDRIPSPYRGDMGMASLAGESVRTGPTHLTSARHGTSHQAATLVYLFANSQALHMLLL